MNFELLIVLFPTVLLSINVGDKIRRRILIFSTLVLNLQFEFLLLLLLLLCVFIDEEDKSFVQLVCFVCLLLFQMLFAEGDLDLVMMWLMWMCLSFSVSFRDEFK